MGRNRYLNGYRELILPYWKRWSVEGFQKAKEEEGDEDGSKGMAEL